MAKQVGLHFNTLCDCFIDVDGENLIERLKRLAQTAHKAEQPVLFQ